jgi:hypothetical protein
LRQDVAASNWENQIKVVFAGQRFQHGQGVDDHRREGNIPFPSFRFGRAHGHPRVRALTHMDDAFHKVHIRPAEAPEFAGAHAGKDGRHQQRTPPRRRGVDYGAEFEAGREVHTIT